MTAKRRMLEMRHLQAPLYRSSPLLRVCFGLMIYSPSGLYGDIRAAAAALLLSFAYIYSTSYSGWLRFRVQIMISRRARLRFA